MKLWSYVGKHVCIARTGVYRKKRKREESLNLIPGRAFQAPFWSVALLSWVLLMVLILWDSAAIQISPHYLLL
jgi:hypothetical protein